MKYYIVVHQQEPELTVIKVANDLVDQFEAVYYQRWIARGSSLMELMIQFSLLDKSGLPETLNPLPVKFQPA